MVCLLVKSGAAIHANDDTGLNFTNTYEQRIRTHTKSTKIKNLSEKSDNSVFSSELQKASKLIKFHREHQVIAMGDNLDSDLLYDDFQENDRKEFDNVNILIFKHFGRSS